MSRSAFLSLLLCLAACPVTAGEATSQTLDAGDWVDISDKTPPDCRSTQGIAVDPTTGNLYLYAMGSRALCLSKDQGETWSKLPCPVSGRGISGFSFNLAYPFTGRMALFTADGTGGLTQDGGATWQEISKYKRSFEFGDVDWSAPKPSLMIAVTHEPFAKSISNDGGASWAGLEDPIKGEAGRWFSAGVFDAKTVLMGTSAADGISISHDRGATWTKTAEFRPLGHRPVHYGTRLYWAASQGVMMTENGKDWKQVGAALPNATWGPYFGKSESEMMVVSDQGMFITRDSARTWNKAADFPKGVTKMAYNKNTCGLYFAWDPIRNLVYSGSMAKSVWRLQVK